MSICRIFLLFIFAYTVLSLKASGPYKLYMLNSYTCNKTSKPFAAIPSVSCSYHVYNTTKNTSLSDMNVTLTKDLKNLKGTVKMYHEEDGKRKLFYLIENISCKSVALTTLMKIWGYKPGKDFCNIPKGTYVLKGLNSDQAFHLWDKNIQYGIMAIKMEFVKGSETVFCSEGVLLVSPDTDSIKKRSSRSG